MLLKSARGIPEQIGEKQAAGAQRLLRAPKARALRAERRRREDVRSPGGVSERRRRECERRRRERCDRLIYTYIYIMFIFSDRGGGLKWQPLTFELGLFLPEMDSLAKKCRRFFSPICSGMPLADFRSTFVIRRYGVTISVEIGGSEN